jgi:hypothetical protein
MAHPATCEWAEPVEGELWEVLESLDEARLAIITRLREDALPDQELKRFSEQFDIARDGLQKLLLDALFPDTAEDLDET